MWWRQEISRLEDKLDARDGVQSRTDKSCTGPETLQPTMLLRRVGLEEDVRISSLVGF